MTGTAVESCTIRVLTFALGTRATTLGTRTTLATLRTGGLYVVGGFLLEGLGAQAELTGLGVHLQQP